LTKAPNLRAIAAPIVFNTQLVNQLAKNSSLKEIRLVSSCALNDDIRNRIVDQTASPRVKQLVVLEVKPVSVLQIFVNCGLS